MAECMGKLSELAAASGISEGFAFMTIFSSGVSLYAMGKLFKLLLGWDFNFRMLIAAIIVLVYIFFGGLTSAIYNEVLQFFLIVFGFIPLVYLGLHDLGGWEGLKARLTTHATQSGFAPTAWTQSWAFMDSPSRNPIGVEWFGLVMGLGFVLSFGATGARTSWSSSGRWRRSP